MFPCDKKGSDRMKVGVDLGGSHIAIGVVNDDGNILEKNEKRLTSVEKQDLEKSIEDSIIENVKQFKKQYEITEVGIGAPGWAVDGLIQNSGNLGIQNYPIVERLKELKLPIQVMNDAKCAALAENAFGCLKGYDRSIFLTLGTGIGGAVFLNHQLLKAGKKPGYEFGHMVIQKNGVPCHCGSRGCFERYASMKVLKDNLRSVLNLNETTSGEELLKIMQENQPCRQNNNGIEKVVCEYIENLSIGIQNLIRIFEPEVIGIGGSFVYFEDVLLPRLRQNIKIANTNDAERKNIKIKTAILGNDAGMIGAVL